MADAKKTAGKDAKKDEKPKIDFDDFAKKIKNLEDRHHVKQLAPAVLDAYMSVAKQHDKDKDLTTYKTKLSVDEAEKLGNSVYDTLGYHVHRRRFNIDKDKYKTLLGFKDADGNSYVDGIIAREFNIERNQLTRSLKEIADGGDDITHTTLEQMLEKPLQHHAQYLTGQIVGKIDPKELGALKEYVKKLVDKHKLDPKVGNRVDKMHDFGDVLNQYISLARQFYQEEPKKDDKGKKK